MAKNKKQKNVNTQVETEILKFDAEVENELNPNGIEIEAGLFENIEISEDLLATQADVDLEGSELESFEAAEIAEIDFIEEEQAESIIESILFASDRPVSLLSIREVFKGTNITKDNVKRILNNLAVEYASGRRGITLEEITGGYQVRTKIDNMNFLKRTLKTRAFKLSGPALETLAIVAYKQPVIKSEIDQIRGVESGHLLRALMEKGLCNFEGKAENLPGRPMQYGTTRRFLEIFGLRNIKELPTLSQIDELLPEGIGEDEDEQKPTLAAVTDSMSEQVKSVSYSQGEEELGDIESELQTITTSSDFFEQEKIRQKQKRDAEKAQDIRDAMTVGEVVAKKDINWLKKYDESLLVAVASAETVGVETTDSNTEITEEADIEISELSFADEDEDSDDETSEELPFYTEADDSGEEPEASGELV